MTYLFIALLVLSGIFSLSLLAYIRLWFQAFVTGTPISLFNIIGMSMRKIPPRTIVIARITLYKAGIQSVTVSDLETHYLAGGKISQLVGAMIAADKAGIALSWRQATAIDLAGRDVLDAVRTSVNPKVIDCPAKKDGEWITAVARDGVQLLCRARVTVRTNLEQLVGGATEETIIARVGEGIVSAIGAADSYQQVLKSPQTISQVVLEKGLDAHSAFEILSIDIADIDVGKNVGASLQADQAQTNMRIAQAKAEERRALAVAQEQENRAAVVLAEAEIPHAMAEALKGGSFGVMDYYQLRNVQADTEMRRALAQEEKEN